MDACQRCGAHAYVRVWHPDHGHLTWCAHHYREHAEALSDQHWHVEADDRAELTPA